MEIQIDLVNMGDSLAKLIYELDTSFVPLGWNDVYVDRKEKNARVVVPQKVESWGLLVPPTKVHIGASPAKYEFLKEDGDEQEASDATDNKIPYLVLSKFDGWLRDPKNDMFHRKMQELKENRALRLGVYFVPETSTAKTTAAAPEPHQCSVGETITFWVRPHEWREDKFLYMIREVFVEPLFRVVETSPDELLESDTIDEPEPDSTRNATIEDEPAEAVSEEAASGQNDDDLRTDGGQETPGSQCPYTIEDISIQTLADVECWQRNDYAIDVAQNRAIDAGVVRDLLGTSEQVDEILEFLNKDTDHWPNYITAEFEPEEIQRDTFSVLMKSEFLDDDNYNKFLINNIVRKVYYRYEGEGDRKRLKEICRNFILPMLENEGFLIRVSLAGGKQSTKGIGEEQVLAKDVKQGKPAKAVRLNVRPTAVLSAYEIYDPE